MYGGVQCLVHWRGARCCWAKSIFRFAYERRNCIWEADCEGRIKFFRDSIRRTILRTQHLNFLSHASPAQISSLKAVNQHTTAPQASVSLSPVSPVLTLKNIYWQRSDERLPFAQIRIQISRGSLRDTAPQTQSRAHHVRYTQILSHV